MFARDTDAIAPEYCEAYVNWGDGEDDLIQLQTTDEYKVVAHQFQPGTATVSISAEQNVSGGIAMFYLCVPQVYYESEEPVPLTSTIENLHTWPSTIFTLPIRIVDFNEHKLLQFMDRKARKGVPFYGCTNVEWSNREIHRFLKTR